MQQTPIVDSGDLFAAIAAMTAATLTAHDWRTHHTTTGPLAGRDITNDRCRDCQVRRTPATERSSCPPEWEHEDQI